MMMRSLAPWMPASTPLCQQFIVKRALCDVGICEMPPGSNRSSRIDEYVTKVGSPLGSYWCAAEVAACWDEAGSDIPPHDAGSCEVWHQWAIETKRFTKIPQIGYAVLYSFAGSGHADHMGIVVRLDPIPLDVEGNTSLTGYSRNGVLVDLKLINTEKVIGYISPMPFTS